MKRIITFLRFLDSRARLRGAAHNGGEHVISQAHRVFGCFHLIAFLSQDGLLAAGVSDDSF